MPERSMVGSLWWEHSGRARVARALLRPAERLYGAIMTARGALYDAGVLRSHALALPAIAVGNLSVGGTGKTPIAAWLAQRLRQRGEVPGILLRGYGGDEPLVHRVLTPGVPVIATPDRLAGAERARDEGATVLVLDDAFQHRRARRDADVVLVSADAWRDRRHLLPAGPWREPLGALRRADLVLVTRKAVTRARAEIVDAILHRSVPGVRTAMAALVPGSLRAAAGSEERALETLDGAIVRAVAAIGDPGAFIRQLELLGADVRPAIYPDHHRFTDAEVATLAHAGGGSAAIVVCTLKDAVKLAPLWPRAARPLWYVSQRVVFERGEEAMERLLDEVLAARMHSNSEMGAEDGP